MQTLSIPHDNLQLNQSELIWGFGISWDKRGWEGGWFSRKIGRFFKMIISPCLVLFRWRWCLLDFTDEGSNAGKIGRACKVFSLLASQCGTYRNLPSYFFDKKFVKATFLWKKLLKSWLHEIFFRWEGISSFSTLYSICKLFLISHITITQIGLPPEENLQFFT